MLRARSRYRNQALGLFVEPGEVLRHLDPATEEHLLRDSPGSFEQVGPEVKGLDAPPADKMIRREAATRKHGGGGVMTPDNFGAVRDGQY